MNLKEARRLAILYGLEGPDWALDSTTPADEIREIIGSDGGCGPGATWGDWLVPDSMWFLNMKPVCYLHDCDYHDAENHVQRQAADMRLFTNGAKYIKARSANWFTIWIRLKRLGKYFRAVNLAGGAFID